MSGPRPTIPAIYPIPTPALPLMERGNCLLSIRKGIEVGMG